MTNEGKTTGEELQWAVQNGDLDCVKTILAHNNSLAKEKLPNGRPPMCVAADCGQTEILKVLHASGADINEKDKHGISPLLSAIYEGHKEAVAYLISQGANVKDTAPDGSTYVECASIPEIKALLS